ncbi:hypothetical protein GO988_20765 [Hymenobacter sp. HMF4947]|uniref:Uncharacterized protein n=1 Tax=Hymenobacter ginkgonis TaxID=2682976 RepID=A0A7K1TK84_9BACT|nr:hypothetical protein [Hymenobacter ginkgonis]MVN78773.1 hypothetical protein [Hymenobacter ginkgonis]
MNKLLSLLLGTCVLVIGCSKEKENAPVPVLTTTKNTIQYQVNGQALTQEARVSYQPASLPTRSFDLLTIEAGDSARASAKEYVQVAFIKGAGRPEVEYGIVAIRFIDSANNLTWGLNLQGTLARSSATWNGSFAGTTMDQFGNLKTTIKGVFSNVP